MTESESAGPASTEQEIAKRVEGKITAGKQAESEDRKRIQVWQQVATFMDAIPAGAVADFLNTCPIGAIKLFLESMPEFQEAMATWSEEYFDSLKRPDIQQHLRRLEKLGVHRETIAIGMKFIRFAPILDNAFAQLGDKREREQRAKRLLVPTQDLDLLANLFGESPGFNYDEFPKPWKTAADLKLLSSMLSWGDIIYDSLRANHLLEVAKFALASLVRETTGKFLDREVGALVDAALKRQLYDETGYRVWRISNYERLESSIPFVSRLFLALNSVPDKKPM